MRSMRFRVNSRRRLAEEEVDRSAQSEFVHVFEEAGGDDLGVALLGAALLVQVMRADDFAGMHDEHPAASALGFDVGADVGSRGWFRTALRLAAER